MAEYLIGRNTTSGAHKKYNPKDWDSMTCRKEMQKVKDKAHSRKLETFMKVCSNFTPAMKYFFLENFSSPVSYYQSMTAYTRSVATNSMVGHILGLGDRHTNNILIDNYTGEIIHIDLGIAFDQGKILPLPETVSYTFNVWLRNEFPRLDTLQTDARHGGRVWMLRGGGRVQTVL